MPEEIQQARGEDGRFAAQTPPADAPVTSEPTTPQPAPASASGERAPVSAAPADTARIDPYAAARKVLNARNGVTDTPPAVAAGDRDPVADGAKPGPTGQPRRDAAESPSPSPSPVASYDGLLSLNEHNLLKSVPGMLVPADDWKGMSPTERVEHIQEVRAIRRARDQQFQQQQRQAATAPAPQPQADHSEPVPPQRGRGARDGVPAPQLQPAGQPDDDVVLPADVQATLDDMAAEYGADSAVVRGQRSIAVYAERVAQQLRQQSEHSQRSAQAAQQERFNRSVEDAQFEALKDKYPTLADQSVRDQLRADIRDYHALRQHSGRPVTPEQAIAFVTHNTLFPEVQKRQQDQAKANRERSLAGTFDRGAPAPATPANPAGAVADKYAEARNALNNAYKAGHLPGREARAHAMAGAR